VQRNLLAGKFSITHQKNSVGFGGIVVTGLAAGAEVLVDKLFYLGLDYQMKWDYIST
jgi:hypothetical protein